MKRSHWKRWVAVLLLLATGTVGGWLAIPRSSTTTSKNATPGGQIQYGQVTRTDLAETQQFSGTLAYTADSTILNRLGGAGGTLTRIAKQGSTLNRNGTLFAVDNNPVILLYGTVPAYRAIRSGIADGPDVKELEQNLSALGYSTGTVDEHFTSSTTSAITSWQGAVGASHTDGVVQLGEVVFLPAGVRIVAELATVGQPAGGNSQVLSVGSTTPVVTVTLQSSQLSLVSVGLHVRIELANGKTAAGTVSAISATQSSSSQGSGGTPTTTATVSLDKAADANGITGSSATVKVITRERKGVMAVPVTALLAQQSGGYVVQVDRGGTLVNVVVTPGLFDDDKGLVEVSATGLQPGDRVVVAAS